MKQGLAGTVWGFILIAVLALSAEAQPCSCPEGGGGAMHEGARTEGMGLHDTGMMQGMHSGMHGGGMMAEGQPLWMCLAGLDLDDKQKNALKALHTKTKKDMVRKKADKQIAHIELQDLLGKDPMDMKAVEASVKKNESLSTDMFLSHIRMREDIKALLTPAQRTQLKQIMEQGRGGCVMMHGDDEDKGEAPR